MIHEEAELRRKIAEFMEHARANVLIGTMGRLESIEDSLNALMAVVLTPTGERFRHEKRGTTYDVYGFGHANSTQRFDEGTGDYGSVGELLVLFDRDEVVIYRDVQSGALSVRGVSEFADGRFTLLPPAGARTKIDPSRTVSNALGIAPAPAPPAAPLQGSRSKPAVKEEPVYVEYEGPDYKKRGQRGSVQEWINGMVRVYWNDPNVMGNFVTDENAINLKIVAELLPPQ